MSGFTDRLHLKQVAYGDADRLEARRAIYRYLKVTSVDLGPHPFRAEGIVGVASTFIDPEPRRVAVDVGCGNGQYVELLGAESELVVAVDLSIGMLRSISPDRSSFAVSDAQRLPFADASVDLVLANHMLYHVPSIEQAVAELRRVLRPDGSLIATTNGSGHLDRLHTERRRERSPDARRPLVRQE